jgi:hypothetical protein
MLVDISMTWLISPAGFLNGAVQINTLYCSPVLAVTTISAWWDSPSSKVLATGQLGQGASRCL